MASKRKRAARAGRLNAAPGVPAIGVSAPAPQASLFGGFSGGGYNGGWQDRRSIRSWRPLPRSADADVLPDLRVLRGRARDLVRNQPIATGAIATVVGNVVGDGLQLQASIDGAALGMSPDQADAWEEAAEREWCHFCCTADLTGVQTFAGLQDLALRAVLESGDVFIARRWREDPGAVYGTRLQVFEADRVCNPQGLPDGTTLTNGNTLAGGVEIDRDGVPLAYWVTNRHPGDIRFGQAPVWSRVAARTAGGERTIIHLYDRLRPELSRGVPYLAPVVEAFKQIGTYAEAEVSAAVISAMIVAFSTSTADQASAPLIGDRSTSPNAPVGFDLASNEAAIGALAHVGLRPGEDVKFPQPGRPNAQFDAFMVAFLRQIGVALELPFELLIKHFTSSYSASRAALEMGWQFFRRRRTWLARNLCDVVYQWMLAEAWARGRLVAPGFADPMVAQAFAGAEWIGPARPSLDPLKDAKADEVDLALGVTTREQICMERTGGDWDKKHAQLAKEESARRAAGLVAPPPSVGGQPGQANAGDQRGQAGDQAVDQADDQASEDA